MKSRILVVSVFLVLLSFGLPAMGTVESGVRIKELCRLKGAQENALVGYGIVTGLAGTGDSSRSEATIQSVTNILRSFGVNVVSGQVQSRNAAAVMVTASLPPYAQAGDRIDVNVTSLGDARSLAGGTLVLTHLTGPDGKVYALAQGAVLVGGYKYELNGNILQKNHPTSAGIPDGATVERGIDIALLNDKGVMEFVLFEPDFTTADRIAGAFNASFGTGVARAVHAGLIEVRVPEGDRSDIVAFLTRAERLSVEPDARAMVVISESTGTVVSGGDVRISEVSITQGDMKIEITTKYLVSQPILVRSTGSGVRTEVVPDTKVDVKEAAPVSVSLPNGTTVAELITALDKVKTSSRDVITVLRAIKRAGALHAELVVQ